MKVVHPPPSPSGAEFLEAPKAPKKIFDWPKARKKIWPNVLREGGGGAPPSGAELLKGALRMALHPRSALEEQKIGY